VVSSGAELLLLDEPTNQLYFATLDVVERALRAYRGAVVVASHDSWFLDAIGIDRVVPLSRGPGSRASRPGRPRGTPGRARS
jgi:ATPase subunit of ABC transporter with duplicated ATPase domains